MTDELLQKVKQNLILEHNADDELLEMYITAAVSYAESYQHIPENYYSENPMPPTTEQAVIMLASHFYESRDGSTGGFFADNVQAGQQVFNTVNLLLRLDRNWKV
ncbi:MAG: head-tail connector protein [Acutalibacteraceae bacterium]